MKNIITIFFILNVFFCFSQNNPTPVSKTKEPEVFDHVEEMAEFPGGTAELMKFIGKNVVFPKRAREDSLFNDCKVYLKFVVTEEGFTSNHEVLKGCPNFPECDEESLRVLKIMPRWRPAKIDGKPVKCYFNIPINFKLK